MRILTLIDAYLPAWRYGGPLRTVAGMVDRLPHDCQLWIVTRDRDLGDGAPFPGVPRDQWVARDAARVRYLSPGAQSVAKLARLIRETDTDLVYANSLFSRLTLRYLLARRLGLVPRRPLLLAPRNELSGGALARKRYKKWPFLKLASIVGLFDGARWQASTEREREEIALALRAMGRVVGAAEILVARDLVAKEAGATPIPRAKKRGAARFVFVSRIVPNKNLLLAIEALAGVSGDATLEVFGPLEDERYWERCLLASRGLPTNVRFSYGGELRHDLVAATFAAHDFFVFPTLFENFGHVVIESLTAGCPVVVSDRTPWRGFEARHAGFDLPLEDLSRWTAILQRCVDMDSTDHDELRKGSIEAGRALADVDGAVRQTVEMFERATGGARDRA
jgi:glycosyltransferase involved in cell wall biosynthesis